MDTSGDDKSAKAGPRASAVGNSNVLVLAQLLQQAQHGHHVGAAGLSGNASDSSLHAALASIMGSSAAAAAATNHLLPNSAPVSSLLPQLPNNTAPHGSLQSQFAALLSGVGGGNPTQVPSGVHTTASRPRFAANHNALRHPTGMHVPTAVTASVSSAMAVPNMQNWSLDRLRQHVQLLEQLKQPVPQTISLLLSEARRKEDKRNAKRIANRKSASTSRARKKAYVQEMTELNARLKRQALILSLLPDMVIVIGVEGNITFCSAQAEKILRYDMQELVGVNLSKLLVPASKDKLNRLIKELLGSEKGGRCMGESAVVGEIKSEPMLSELEQESHPATQPGGASSGENSPAPGPAAIVSERMSEPSFPLSVVKVEAKRDKSGKKKGGPSDDQDNSDTSNTSASDPRKQPSSLTASNSSERSASGAFPKESVVGAGAVGDGKRKSQFPSSDVSNTSSISTNAKNVQQANTNLERNVRIHNKKMKAESGKFRDDVTGADVTANNASARLSSLQHRPESSSSEEDSGYRESNDSREETSSSVSDSSGSNGRRKPIAPACNICLIRKDLTTLWCEVTSSIRTKEPEEDEAESLSATGTESGKRPLSTKTTPLDATTSSELGEPKEEAQIELLLCLRPVRDGDQKMHGKLRFEGSSKKNKSKKRPAPDDSWKEDVPSPVAVAAVPNRPIKKRGLAEVSKDTTSTSKESDECFRGVDTDAAESLMLMTKKTP